MAARGNTYLTPKRTKRLAIAAMEAATLSPLREDDADRQPCQERQDNARNDPFKTPCSTTTGTAGAGDEYGRCTVPGQLPWPSSGMGGDVAADQSRAGSDVSQSTEYLTPAGSLLSLDFCSTFDIFPWEEEDAETEQIPLRPRSADTSTSHASILSQTSKTAGEKEDEQHPAARILDVSSQRVDYRTTPSTTSLLSSTSSTRSTQKDYIAQGYHSLSNSDSSDRFSDGTTTTSGSSYVQSTSPTPPRTPVRVVDPSVLSTSKLLKPWLEDPLEPRIEQRPRPTWVRPWAGLCVRLQRLLKCRRDPAGRRRRTGGRWYFGRQRRNAATNTTPCRAGQQEGLGRNADDVFNVSSDDFYTGGTRWWDVRRIYQRCVSYLHGLWCRRSL
ncbi:uncharacterized protein LOC142785262 [Rhipicephalus microplus]|uniref:uncharacterized protein LOC142785262 n=1 Tax=Rhipicephalus microplus TaxID=6941 RepID=UPI003F6C962D